MKKARKVLVVIVILNIYSSLISWSDITSATMETDERIIIDFKEPVRQPKGCFQAIFFVNRARFFLNYFSIAQ
jgi:hypothetical protein